MKRYVCAVTALLLLFLTPGFSARAEESKAIDLYIVAGQSNAVGYSTASTLTSPIETYENVWYMGDVQRSRSLDVRFNGDMTNIKKYRRSVTIGYGANYSCLGPEYGMARVLDGYYTGSTKAFIVKSGAGDTSLRNIGQNGSGEFGNWYPPSLWGTDQVDGTVSAMGIQYYNLIENFRMVYTTLVENGYTPKVRGFAWMQGCADIYNSASYEMLLTTFITDVRADLVEITGDESLYQMPFVIGEIAVSYAEHYNPSAVAMNAIQRTVASKMEAVYTVPTADLIIVRADGSYSGADPWHFSGEDMQTLGMRFAQAILDTQQVTVTYENDDEKGIYAGETVVPAGSVLSVSVSPVVGWQVASVTFNGIEMEYDRAENCYTLRVEESGTVRVEYEKATAAPSTKEEPALWPWILAALTAAGMAGALWVTLRKRS